MTIIGEQDGKQNWKREHAIKNWKKMYDLRYEKKWKVERIAAHLKHNGKRYRRQSIYKGIAKYRAIINLVH